MKKTFFICAAVAALAAAPAIPAAAQYPQNSYARAQIGFDDRVERLEARLEAGIRAGTIDRREARRLRQELRTLSRLERRYSRDGIDRQEHDDLRRRVATLRQQIRTADRGSWDRYERFGEWDEYDRGYAYDRGRGYDDRGYGDRGYYGRGGPDDALNAWCSDQVSDRGGIGGLIETLLGGGGLRVGQRVTANLYAVPYEYRDRYRDGYGVHYRSDGRVVYEIDDRTMTVTRICRMDR